MAEVALDPVPGPFTPVVWSLAGVKQHIFKPVRAQRGLLGAEGILFQSINIYGARERKKDNFLSALNQQDVICSSTLRLPARVNKPGEQFTGPLQTEDFMDLRTAQHASPGTKCHEAFREQHFLLKDVSLTNQSPPSKGKRHGAML
ncbi:hypothetical protein EYF80_057429 [Liparis tanakae]|uniref:Uncharacterized protein n=1 Tax=Liparis tanakae TaxID=230148 RepID=A0A4Z2EUH0_9TELE|nr:hypothetical protein EYF80_057429 [Liparis tanakae]